MSAPSGRSQTAPTAGCFGRGLLGGKSNGQNEIGKIGQVPEIEHFTGEYDCSDPTRRALD